MTFRLTMLPAREGDCLLVTYGSAGEYRILIDGGRTGTWTDVKKRRMLDVGPGSRFEAIVVTHIDRDHIEGALKLCEDVDFNAEIGEVWFNAYRHLDPTPLDEALGPAQAEQLSDAIVARSWNWNARFGGGPVRIEDGEDPPKGFELPGGLLVTLLSPTVDGLRALKPEWNRWLKEAGFEPNHGPPEEEDSADDVERMGGSGVLDLDTLCQIPEDPDDARPNGSSIAFLLQYDGKSALLCADAHPHVLEATLRRLSFSPTNRLKLDLMKVPHHGSGRNVTGPLLSMVDCNRFAISTNGSRHEHPDDTALARIVRSSERPKTLYFNYGQRRLSGWSAEAFMRDNGFTCVFPKDGEDGLLAIDI